MTTETLPRTVERSLWANRLRALLTQENIITIVISVIVGAAVILPLVTLFISSFKVLDPLACVHVPLLRRGHSARAERARVG